jgi:hypothetical protein
MSEKWSEVGLAAWEGAEPITVNNGGVVYLGGRGISLIPGPEVLRFHPGLAHPKLKKKMPAIIAKVTGSEEPSFNVTWLRADGKDKAKIDKADQRRTFGSSRGGVVQLGDVVVGQPVLIAEGIESALTGMEATGLPGLASLGTSGLRNIELPESINEVIFCGENDEANRRALAKACPAFAEKGIKVRVAMPPAGKKDLNDLVKGGESGGLAMVRMCIDAAPEWAPKRPKADAERQPSQSSFLFELAVRRSQFFCDPAGEPHTSFVTQHSGGEHHETHRIRSKGFNQRLRLWFYEERHNAPSNETMASTIKTLAAKAVYDRDVRNVYQRVAALDGKIYVDMCDDAWRAIEIDPDGYRVIEDPPVHFRRSPGMLALPTPSRIDPKKGIARLDEVLKLGDKRDAVVILAWMLSGLSGRPPYAVLSFIGEPGSTKTSAAYVVRSAIDPNAAPLRSRPRDPHDVYVAANHSLVVAYYNLSSLSDVLSDTICTITEGSAESRRELFTDADEYVTRACAPFLLTSIESVALRGDLAQRTLYVRLASVADKDRVTEQTFKARFRRIHPDLLGALCGGVSVGLRVEKTLEPRPLPRLATFFHWGLACSSALWPPGVFESAFALNAADAVDDVVESDVAAATFRRFMLARGREWTGTATELLAELIAFVRRPVREAEAAHHKAAGDDREYGSNERDRTGPALSEARDVARDILGDRWPKTPNALAGKLKRASPALRYKGIEISWPTRHGEVKNITAKLIGPELEGQTASQSSSPSQNPANPPKPRDDKGNMRDDPRESWDDHDERDDLVEGGTVMGPSPSDKSSLEFPSKSNGVTPPKSGGGDRDDVWRPLSGADDAAADDDSNSPYIDDGPEN